MIVIDQVDSSLAKEFLPKEDNINKNDFMSGVNIILDILKEDSEEPAGESKKIEPVKKYLLPFVSEDKKENKEFITRWICLWLAYSVQRFW